MDEIIRLLDDILGIIELQNQGKYPGDALTAIANRVFIIKTILREERQKKDKK